MRDCGVQGETVMCAVSERTIAVVVALIIATGARADMIGVSCSDTGPPTPKQQRLQTGLESTYSPEPFPGFGQLDLKAASVAFLPAGVDGATPSTRQEPLHVLTDDHGSLDLCLYALLGLGLCRSAPWVRRLSIGHIPDWYDHNGPHQIGHSYAIEPNCLCSATLCFGQPHTRAEGLAPQYRLGTFVFLWRRSQFTPTLVASRGPPLCQFRQTLFPRVQALRQ